MAVSNGDLVRAVMEAVLPDGTIAQNVFHWKAFLSGDITDYACLLAVATVLDAMYAEIEEYISEDVVFNPITLSRVGWDNDDQVWKVQAFIGQIASAVEGENIADLMPNQMAAVIRGITNRPKTFGRKFVYGLVDTAATAGDLVTAVVTALNAWAADYIADVTVGQEGVLTPGVPRTAVNEWEDFQSSEVGSIMGTQRRRKPEVGI